MHLLFDDVFVGVLLQAGLVWWQEMGQVTVVRRPLGSALMGEPGFVWLEQMGCRMQGDEEHSFPLRKCRQIVDGHRIPQLS